MPSGSRSGATPIVRLGHVFSNLLGNSVQYSPPGSGIQVNIDCEAEQIVLSVHNFGDPIPPEKLTSIFQPMTRGGDPAGQSTGLGLGLFIAQKIVLAHGDNHTVTSSADAGTVFKASLPRR